MSVKQDNLAASQKPHDRNYDVLSDSESKRLLQAVGADPTKVFLHDIITIVLNTGLRLGELGSLRVEDVDLTQRMLTIRLSKAGTRRHIPFNEDVAQVLSARISANPSSQFLFGEAANARIKNASRLLAKISERVLGRPIFLHTLRHTFIVNVLNAGMRLDVVMYLCGWKCAASPMKHLAKVTSPLIARAYEEAIKKAREEN